MQSWREHHENRVRLDGCSRHRFEPITDEQLTPGNRIECKNCGGWMDLVGLNYYVRGYEAAGKNGNDILPNWKPEPEPPSTRRFFKGPDEP